MLVRSVWGLAVLVVVSAGIGFHRQSLRNANNMIDEIEIESERKSR